MKITRRALLLSGTAAVAAVAAVPVYRNGLDSFLRRSLADHFGSEILNVEGIDDFVADYAALAGTGNAVKRVGANLYFAGRGDLLHKIGPARALEDLFLQTILTRSNVIAVYQGRDTELSYTEVDPWQPTCGLYLSALGEVDSTTG